MSPNDTTHLSTSDGELSSKVRKCIDTLLQKTMQPSAEELIRYIENEVGWSGRWMLSSTIEEMLHDKDVAGYQREYLRFLYDNQIAVDASAHRYVGKWELREKNGYAQALGIVVR